MSSIQPTGASGVANLPAASSASAKDVPTDGMEWGLNVAEASASDPTFNFDTYAQNVATSMASAGYSPSQVSQFVNAMYAGYLMDGGTATSEATGVLGSGPSTAGIVGNPNTWGSLDLPGVNGAAGVETPENTTVALSPSTAYNLGTQFGATSSNANYPQLRANLEADLQRSGYSQTDVTQFMQQFDAGYNAAKGGTSPEDLGDKYGAMLASQSNGTSFNLETYLTGTLQPWLQQSGGMSTPAMVNEYLDSFRASYLAGGSSANTALMAQASEQGADLVAQNQPGFNLENYINTQLPAAVPNWSTMSAPQKEMYVNALTAGYLRAGGTQTASASTIVAPSVSGMTAGATSTPPGVTSTPANTTSTPAGGATSTPAGATSNAAGIPVQAQGGSFNGLPLAASAPANAAALYAQYVNSSSPALASDANNLQSSLSSLSATQSQIQYAQSQYNVALSSSTGAAADSTGSMQNVSYWGNLVGSLKSAQQAGWQQVRTQESQFYGDLSKASGDPNASTAATVYQNYVKDPFYTLEGEMPSTFAGQPISNGTSSGVGSSTPSPVSSAALNALLQVTSASALPATVSNELTNPFATSSMSQGDYTQIVEGYMKLFDANPSAYYQSLGNIKDPNLAGAINFSVQDMQLNHPQEMVANGAPLSNEQKQIGTYFSEMQSTATMFTAWAPSQGAGAAYSGPSDINSIVGSANGGKAWNNAGNVESIMSDPTATSDGKHDEHNFSDAAQMMASLYKTNPAEYYQALTKIADPALAFGLNRAVTQEFAQNPKNFGTSGNHAADQDFKGMWAGIASHSSASDVNIALNASSPTNGD